MKHKHQISPLSLVNLVSTTPYFDSIIIHLEISTVCVGEIERCVIPIEIKFFSIHEAYLTKGHVRDIAKSSDKKYPRMMCALCVLACVTGNALDSNNTLAL